MRPAQNADPGQTVCGQTADLADRADPEPAGDSAVRTDERANQGAAGLLPRRPLGSGMPGESGVSGTATAA